MSTLPAYRHVQWYLMLWIVLPFVLALVTVLGVLGGFKGVEGFVVLAVSQVGTVAFLGRLVIEIRDDRLHWGFGWLGWPRWSVALAEIEGIERLRAPHIAGSGIKGRAKDRLYNVTIGGPALKLTLTDGRKVTLGTPEPERLQAFLEARMPRRR